MDKLWLVKDHKDRIFGPYTETEICFYIAQGKFKGEELFCSYPTGKWSALSTHPVFYEAIVDQLQGKTVSDKNQSDEEQKDISLSEDESVAEDAIESTHIITPKEIPDAHKKKKVKLKLSKEFKEEVLAEEGVFEEKSEGIIEMESDEGFFLDKLKPALKTPLLIFVLLTVVTVIFLNLDGEKQKADENVRILSVEKRVEPWTEEEVKLQSQQALLLYLKGTVSNYLKAQRRFVRILEGSPDKVEIYHYLCLIYLEIWPFAYQDTRDKKSLSHTVNLVSQKDRTRVYSDVCKSVQAFIDNKFEKSLMLTNNSLNMVTDQSPIFFYYIKSKALKHLHKITEARSYLQSIHQLRPEWVAPYMLSADIFYEQRKYDLAGKVYQKVLSIFPEHTSAGLRMGVLEYRYLKKPQKSEERLKSILLSLSDFVLPNILLESYITLASIYLKQNNEEGTLEYINKAYALDPEHPDVLLLKSKLGGEANFENTRVQARGLIYKGDILVSQGKCSEAQNYFKKAYTAGTRRNPKAAVRIAQCYWKSGAYGQAVRWLKRAINADGKFLEAYFILSAYLSELYDFESAKEILNTVKRHRPSNYDLFKAYAILAFRQKQYQAAVAYAERSLQFYTSDVEVYVLLSKTHRLLGNASKAFSNAQKAIREDASVEAQIVYAYALDVAYGFHRSEAYLKKLIANFPLIIEYSQALGEYYFEKNMYEKALAEFESLIERRSDFKPAYMYAGRIYSYLSFKKGGAKKEYEKALKYFLEAILLDPSDPEPLFYLGTAHLDNKNYEAAEQEFEKILRINANYPLIHYYIGLVNFYQAGEENLDKALKFAKVQSAKTPNHYLPYKLSGDVYRLRSKGAFRDLQKRRIVYDLCAKEYQKALRYLKKDIEISLGLIECYKGSGNLDIALHFALQLKGEEGLSGYPDIYREIGSIYEAKDQYEQARSYYMDYFKLNPGAKDRTDIQIRINKLIKERESLSQPEEENEKN